MLLGMGAVLPVPLLAATGWSLSSAAPAVRHLLITFPGFVKGNVHRNAATGCALCATRHQLHCSSSMLCLPVNSCAGHKASVCLFCVDPRA